MEINPNKHFFTSQLLDWHTNSNFRTLPWKSEKDPYKIWLSEIILQQTRAQQALPYYLGFIDAYPAITDIANAKDEDVFRLWQGLGYYNRCKNMLATARYITQALGAVFPADYESILSLKGIGPYTAAAIASFAYGLPHAVVDGNVYRVLARYFGIDIPSDATEGKRYFALLAQELLDTTKSAAYNQAIMDLGATVCTPRLPLCEQCPLHKKCIAYHRQLIDVLPVKLKKQSVKQRYFHYLVLKFNDTIWINKRTAKDIWANLHEPMLIEHSQPLDINSLLTHEKFINAGFEYNEIKSIGEFRQRLTHQMINTQFFMVELKNKPRMGGADSKWMNSMELKKAAFPKTLVSFLENNLYF
jgi:A/G-specific adenine glycosylase